MDEKKWKYKKIEKQSEKEGKCKKKLVHFMSSPAPSS